MRSIYLVSPWIFGWVRRRQSERAGESKWEKRRGGKEEVMGKERREKNGKCEKERRESKEPHNVL